MFLNLKIIKARRLGCPWFGLVHWAPRLGTLYWPKFAQVLHSQQPLIRAPFTL